MKLTATLPILASVATIANAAPLEKRAGTSYNGGNTANDVVNKICAPVTLIFARGSTESGNMGSSVGPALAKALISQLGASGVAIQGVDYEATIASNANMGSGGGPVMASLAKQALSQCPNTKIAISGYSQGGTVTHYAVKSAGLSPDSVSSAVLFGDPLLRQSVGNLPASKVKEFCASGDGVCEGGTFSISAAHLSYTSNGDTTAGAQFIAQQAGTSSGSASTTGSTPSTSTPATTSTQPAASTSATAAASTPKTTKPWWQWW
nr:hypothetical protein B0A51_07984 [Rachicladosporium sp. CCFEE 5018]